MDVGTHQIATAARRISRLRRASRSDECRRVSPCHVLAFVLVGVLLPVQAQAEQITVMISGAFYAAYQKLVPEFERATRNQIVTVRGASMGGGPNSIPKRLDHGELADVVIMAEPALRDLIARGQVIADSRVDLVRSSIGMIVKAGAPKPNISTVDAFKRTLLAARSIAYSASASGVYLSTELFPRLGIADQVRNKSMRIESDLGAKVASGEAEIGFQQISELLPIAGVDYVGPIPAEVQRVTIFSAGIPSHAHNRDAAKVLIKFLSSTAAAPVIKKSGLDPISSQ
jgi:molybdate transport system substrate-binding protein